jgi:DNA primase
LGRIPEETLQTIRERIDIVEVVGRHVTLKQAGRSHKGLCPFHEEKTPSFTVNPERGIFHCFGCGESGNVFSFLMQRENLTFPEVVRSLAAECGVVVPERSGGETGLVEAVLRANEVAQRVYRDALRSQAGGRARTYLRERGLDHEEVDRYGIGWASPGWEDLVPVLAAERVTPSMGVRAGLLRERESGGCYDLLRDRITFPIQDVRGRVVGFGGRALGANQEPKYLNSPETPIFRKREGFYGFPRALEAIRLADRVVVVEGYFDQIALDRAGVPEAVATCGTALSEQHARNLRRRTRNVVLVFDGDDAGRRAALRALEVLLPQGLRVRAAALPPGEDPHSLLQGRGADALRALVDAAVPALELAIESAVESGCRSPEEKADAVAAVVPLLALISDPTERTAWCQRLALRVGGRETDVLASVRAVARGATPEEAVRPAVPPPSGPEERHIRQLVTVLLQHPVCAAEVDSDALLSDAAPFWLHTLPPVLAACRTGRDPLEDETLAPEALDLLHALAAADGPAYEDAKHAGRAVAEIVGWFERRLRRAEQRELTDLLRASAPDETLHLLRRKAGVEAT